MENMYFDTGLKGIKERVIQDGIYAISLNEEFIQILGICDKSIEPKSFVNFSEKTYESHQFFFIKYDNKNDCYTIMALNSRLYLGVEKKENSNYNNSLVIQCMDPTTHLINWDISFDDGYSFQLKGYDYNLQYCETVLLREKNNSVNQNFYIKTIKLFDTGFYYISSLSPDKHYISFSNNEEQKQSFLNYKNSSDHQLFCIIFDENDGCYSIISNNNLKCLSSNLQQADYYNLDYQKWIFETNDNSESYSIILKSDYSFLCNSVSKNDENRNLCLKKFQKIYAYNCKFQLEKQNNSLFTKIVEYVGYQNQSIVETILQIRERMNFRYCTKIIKSDLEKIVKKVINSQVFKNSFILKYLEIPLSISGINDSAFSNCYQLKSIKCHPKWLKLLPNPANIENMIIQDGVEIIEDDPFNKLNNLKYLSIPCSFKFENCDKNLFQNIYGLKTFDGDPSFLSIIQKDELSILNIPYFVKVIPRSICSGCKSLKEVNIEEQNSKLETIEPKAFADCPFLRYVSIPQSVKNIAPNSFKRCNKYFTLKLNESQKKSMLKNLIIDQKDTRITDDYKHYLNITSIEIPLTVQECENQILRFFTKLKKVKCDPRWLNNFNTKNINVVSIPDQITKLRKADFENLTSLIMVEIPESVQEIEKDTFKNCEKLFNVKCGTKHFKYLNKEHIKSICLNEQVNSINETDFDGFINLESIKIIGNIIEIKKKAFANCKKLMNIDYPNGKSLINNSISIDKNKERISKEDFEGWINLTKLEIPKSIKIIDDDAFKDCINLKELTCDPELYSSIPKSSIIKVTVPNFVKKLDKGQFDGFNSLAYVELPNEIIINDKAIFDSCENLKIIRCRSSIFNQLSKKTIERCDSKIKIKYENPIFNFQPDETKVFDETQYSDDHKIISSFMNSSNFNSTRGNVDKSMNIDRLVAFDGFIVNYVEGINEVIRCIQSTEVIDTIDPNNINILEISKVCGAICNKIAGKIKIIPNVVQIYAILRLANEILNQSESRGSIGEIKPGEGKSFIIAIVTIILIRYNRTIDIITSNLKLARQYKEEQSRFFDLFNIKTAVLLVDENNDSDLFDEFEQNPRFNLESFDCPVVYSTYRTFEYYYLHILFSMIPRKRELDVALIDDVDNMFINELDSPVTILKQINYVYSIYILCYVFAMRQEKVSTIKQFLDKEIPNAGPFDEHEFALLKDAAIKALDKKKDIDYKVENNQIVIIDPNTGCKMPYSYWPIYLLQMIEIIESVSQTPVALSLCQITHQEYLKLYKKIVGITGTLGSDSDEKNIRKDYKVNTFKVPPNFPSEVEIYYKNRPNTIDEVFNSVNKEISDELIQNKRPVLIIWDSKYNAIKFMESIKYKNVGVIFGVDLKSDEDAIKSLGQLGRLTVTTSFAIKNINIVVSKEAKKKGGLHIVIPMKISNIRTLDKLVNITGRRGKPGSVTLLISKEDLYVATPSFDQKNVYLESLQNLLAKDIKEHFPWMLCGKNKNDFGDSEIPFAANYNDIFNILSRQMYLIIKENTTLTEIDLLKVFQDLSWLIVQIAWGSFFSNIQNNNIDNDDCIYCNREYNRFISELQNYFSFDKSTTIESALDYLITKYKDEINNEHIIYNGLKISRSGITLLETKSSDMSTLDSIQNQEAGIHYYIKTISNKIIQMKDALVENINRIPQKSLLSKTPQVEIDIFEIDFIKMTMVLANEAYKGHFSFGRVVKALEVNDIYQPMFYCIEYLNMLFVVTRGSKSDKDWMTDFKCKEACRDFNGTKIYIHKGFLGAALYILNHISEFLVKKYEKILFVGHSYAAAVSNVLCYLTKADPKFKDENIFSLAFAPPPSMSKVPAYIQRCMFSFINRYDIVPHLSLNNIKKTMTLNGKTIKEFIPLILAYLKKVDYAFDIIKNITDFIENNKDEIYQILDSVGNDFHVNKNIGNIFFIGLFRSKKLRNYQVDETDLNDVLVFLPTIFSDHRMSEYISSFDIIREY